MPESGRNAHVFHVARRCLADSGLLCSASDNDKAVQSIRNSTSWSQITVRGVSNVRIDARGHCNRKFAFPKEEHRPSLRSRPNQVANRVRATRATRTQGPPPRDLRNRTQLIRILGILSNLIVLRLSVQLRYLARGMQVPNFKTPSPL